MLFIKACFAEISLFLWARCPPCDIRRYRICTTFIRRDNFLVLQIFFVFQDFVLQNAELLLNLLDILDGRSTKIFETSLQREAVASSTGDEVPFDGHLSVQMMDLDRQALKAVATATSSRALKERNASKDGKKKKTWCELFAIRLYLCSLLRSSPYSLGKPGFFSCIHVHFRSVFFALAFFISKPVASGMFYFF